MKEIGRSNSRLKELIEAFSSIKKNGIYNYQPQDETQQIMLRFFWFHPLSWLNNVKTSLLNQLGTKKVIKLLTYPDKTITETLVVAELH